MAPAATDLASKAVPTPRRFGGRRLGAFVASLLAAVLVAMPAGAATPIAATSVGTDARYDWGTNWGPGLAKVGEALGEDLVGAEVAATSDTITFVFKVTVLPMTYANAGSVPGVPVYHWEMGVDGRLVIVRGTFRPEDPGCVTSKCMTSTFVVQSNCKTTAENSYMECEQLGRVPATFAQGPPGTITVEVPRELIGADDGTVIGPMRSPFAEYVGGNLIATTVPPYSDALYPADWMDTVPFRVSGSEISLLKKGSGR